MYTIPKIVTLDQLKQYLHSGPGYDGYDIMMKSVDLPKSAYDQLCKWDSNTYTKIVLEREMESYELVLICWEPGQSSPIHDHKGSETWIKVLEGELTEHTYYRQLDEYKPEIRDVVKYTSADLLYMRDNFGLHKISNDSSERTISLHLYAPPIEEGQKTD